MKAHSLSFALPLLIVSLMAGCNPQPSAAGPAGAPAASVPAAAGAPAAAAVPAASASAAAVAAQAPAAQPKAPLRTAKKVASELRKRCQPAEPAETNMEMKVQASETNECIQRAMVADLDRVLVPLKASDPARFKALMAEQASWNRFVQKACSIEEELQWLNFEEGMRDDGTARGYATLGCEEAAYTERDFYARLLASSDAASLSRRIEEVQKRGAQVRATLADRKKKATRWIMTVPPPHEYGIDGDWKGFVEGVEAMEKATDELARSTCAGWPELASALGGESACQKKAALYYFTQGNMPPEPVR